MPAAAMQPAAAASASKGRPATGIGMMAAKRFSEPSDDKIIKEAGELFVARAFTRDTTGDMYGMALSTDNNSIENMKNGWKMPRYYLRRWWKANAQFWPIVMNLDKPNSLFSLWILRPESVPFMK